MRRFAVILLLVCLPTSIPGQQKETRLRVDVRLVLLNTLVNLPTGAPATGLRSEDFRVLEDAQEQPLAVFAAGAMPVHVALLVDTSGSTRNSLPELKKAARRFIEQFGLDDQLALYDFGPDLMRLQEFTTDRRAVTQALNLLEPILNSRDLPKRRRRAPVLAEAKPPGGTMLYDSLALLEAEFPDEAQRRVILVLTDGLDNASQRSLEEVSRTLLRGSTVIYAVMPRSLETPKRAAAIQRASAPSAKKKWTVILDLSGASPKVEQLIRETAARFLENLDPAARVWLLEYREKLQLLCVSPNSVVLDSHGVPAPVALLEAQGALAQRHFWTRANGSAESKLLKIDAEHELVLTDARHSGVWKLIRDAALRRPDFAALNPEQFPAPEEQELVLQTLLRNSDGGVKAASLARQLSEERVAQKFRELVRDTGGVVLEARRAQDLGNSYAQIAQLIRSSYTLGYYTKAKPGRHALRVETPGKNLTVRSRRVVLVEE